MRLIHSTPLLYGLSVGRDYMYIKSKSTCKQKRLLVYACFHRKPGYLSFYVPTIPFKVTHRRSASNFPSFGQCKTNTKCKSSSSMRET